MALQGRTWESVLELALMLTPVEGVLHSDLIVNYRKTGEDISTKLMTADDWQDLGGGVYVLSWSEEEMNTIGSFWFKVSGASFNSITKELEITPNMPSLVSMITTCVVSGNIVDIGGNPSSQQPITFRIAKNPSTLGGAFIAGARLHTMPDAYGAFSVALARNAKVIVEIEGAGIRQQITIPDAETANLLDLLPPITN